MAKTFKQIMDEARRVVPEVSVDEVRGRLDRGGRRDARSTCARRRSTARAISTGAISLPRGFLEMRVEETVPDKDAPIVAYCAGGTRSLLAGRTLKEMGYTNVVSMTGGLRRVEERRACRGTQDQQFTPEQLNRYSRHFLLPEVGEAGQAKLLDAKVLLHRRRRARLADGALPRRGRRRHARHRRPRRRRPLEPAAPDPPHQRPHRHAEGRVGAR